MPFDRPQFDSPPSLENSVEKTGFSVTVDAVDGAASAINQLLERADSPEERGDLLYISEMVLPRLRSLTRQIQEHEPQSSSNGDETLEDLREDLEMVLQNEGIEVGEGGRIVQISEIDLSPSPER